MMSGELDNVSNSVTVEIDGYFLGPRTQKAPPVHRLEPHYVLGHSERHIPAEHYLEPKVISPFKTRPGQIPRRIQVDRKKRAFVTVNITEALQKNGVLPHLISTINITREDTIDSMPLSMFYNSDFDSRSLESWMESANESDLMGRAMCVKEVRDVVTIAWKPCTIVGASDDLFYVRFYNEDQKVKPHEQSVEPTNYVSEQLDRIFICFDAEDPEIYCAHLLDAMKRKSETASSVALNLYVDCMPMDGLKELNSEQISRILDLAVNVDSLRQNTFLDTNALLQQFNMNHMRTLNQLILSDLLHTRITDIKTVQIASTDVELFHDPSKTFTPTNLVTVNSDITFAERINEFKFNSLWNKPEPVSITLQLTGENVNIQSLRFYTIPEKTVRLDEFVQSQQFAANTMAAAVKENW